MRTEVSVTPTTSGMSARRSGIGMPRTRQNANSSAAAIVNRTHAMASGGISAVAHGPATHVSPKLAAERMSSTRADCAGLAACTAPS